MRIDDLRLMIDDLRGRFAAAILTAVLVITTTGVAGQQDAVSLLETHAANKQRVLEEMRRMPTLALTKRFGTDFRAAWRHILIDGPVGGLDKRDFLQSAMQKAENGDAAVQKTLASLTGSHRRLFGSGGNADLMIRYAGESAFEPFGRHLTRAAALAEMTAGNPAEVQAFQTLFETGRNTRGYVHKLECHGQAVEYIYAVTDIVYGVMLPCDLDYGQDKVTADPARVRLFYVKAGEVIALRPYVLHSGSLSVEPDRSFSILIYKKPAATDDQKIELPQDWQQRQDCLKIAGVDKFFLTLEELHTDDLKTNRGFITGQRPLRLPHGE